MTTTTPYPTETTETVNGIPLPKFSFQVVSGKNSPAEFILDINPNEVLLNAVKAMYKWLFSPTCVPKHVTSIAVSIAAPLTDEPSSPSARLYASINDGGEAIVRLSDAVWIDRSYEEAKIHIIDHIIGCAAGFLTGAGDDYPLHFWIGIANYARLKEDSYPAIDIARQKNEKIWHGKNTMPYFLGYLDKRFGENTVRTIFEELEPSYNKGVFQKVKDVPITTLWKDYRAVVGIEETPGEEWISDLNELWFIPQLSISLNVDPKHEGLRGFYETIEKPIEALAKAVLATVKHLHTPRTAPTHVQEFRLVLQSGISTKVYWATSTRISDTVVELYLSLDAIQKYKAETLMVGIITSFYAHNCTAAQNKSMLKNHLTRFILPMENLVPPLTKIRTGQEVSRLDFYLADFSFWLESTRGYRGTMKKFCKLLNMKKEVLKEEDEDWKSCFKDHLTDLTGSGKTFTELWKEYESAFPEMNETDDPEQVKDAELNDLANPRAPEGPGKGSFKSLSKN